MLALKGTPCSRMLQQTSKPRSKPLAPLRTASRTSRTAAVRVVAFRDEQRVKDLLKGVNHFVKYWFDGVKTGLPAVQHDMDMCLDRDVVYRCDHVLERHDLKGEAALMHRLSQEHKKLRLDSWRMLASAANPDEDSAYALVEFRYQADGQAGCVGYEVIKIGMMIDDTVCRITDVWQRGQLTAQDMPSLQKLAVAAGTAGIDADLCKPTPFPEEDLGPAPQGRTHEQLAELGTLWCRARSTGESESLLDDALDKKFRLWDAYGLLPVLCDPTRRSQPDACVVRYEVVKDIIKAMKERYDISCRKLDAAVSDDTNAGFTHWSSHIVNRSTKQEFKVEAVEVDLFSGNGRLQDVWMFRDPMDFEREMLTEALRKEAARK